jgi:hypothetical protein
MGAGMNARDLPYGAREIAELRSTGQRPVDLVLISFIGPLRESNPVIVAQPSRSYDWRFLVGLHVAAVVKTDTPNVASIVKAVEAAKPATLAIWFADKQDGGERRHPRLSPPHEERPPHGSHAACCLGRDGKRQGTR